jgi:hypothetical protein
MSAEWADLAQEAANIMHPIDEKLAKELRAGTTPESLYAITRRCLSKVGRKSHFDQDKVTHDQWDKLIDLEIACLKRVLELAYSSYNDREKSKYFSADREVSLATFWEVWDKLSREERKEIRYLLTLPQYAEKDEVKDEVKEEGAA